MFNQTPIGGLGGTHTKALGIGRGGQVVGWSDTGSGQSRAFLFDANGLRDLGVAPLPIPQAFLGLTTGASVANAVTDSANGNVLVAGTSRAFTVPNPPSPIPGNLLVLSRASLFTVDLGGNLSGADLGTLNPGPVPGTFLGSSEANDINVHGQIVGVSDVPGGGRHAFLHDATLATPMISLGTLDHDPLTGLFRGSSEAYGINDRGDIVGVSDTGQFDPSGVPIRHAFLFSIATMQMRDLGTLLSPVPAPPPGLLISEAHAVDNVGRVVGISTSFDASGAQVTRAFLFDPSLIGVPMMSDLGTLAPGNAFGTFHHHGSSRGLDVDNHGHVVGAAATTTLLPFGREDHAFRTTTGPLVDVHLEMILNLGAIAVEATGINDAGQVCVNVRDATGVMSPVLLTPVP